MNENELKWYVHQCCGFTVLCSFFGTFHLWNRLFLINSNLFHGAFLWRSNNLSVAKMNTLKCCPHTLILYTIMLLFYQATFIHAVISQCLQYEILQCGLFLMKNTSENYLLTYSNFAPKFATHVWQTRPLDALLSKLTLAYGTRCTRLVTGPVRVLGGVSVPAMRVLV